MNKDSEWKVPKWPFLLMDAIFLVAAEVIVQKAAHLSGQVCGLVVLCVVLGAVVGCLPFILDYKAAGKLIEVNGLGEVSEKIQDLKSFTTQVATVTDQWARVHETTQGSAEKTAKAAHEITERIAAEVRDFAEFQKKMNDAEKGALRLEVDKLRRVEGEWLQVLVRVLDHIYALYTAAVRTGQPELIGQIGQFQNACRDSARRVGLVSFAASPDEPFDAERHRAHGVENPPAGAITGETLALGLTFQGRLLRPALVRLRDDSAPVPSAPAPETEAAQTETVSEVEPAPEPENQTPVTETPEPKAANSDELPLG